MSLRLAPALPVLADKRPNQQGNRDDCKGERKGPREDWRDISRGHHQSGTQFFFGQRCEDETNDEGAKRDSCSFKEKSDHPKQQHDPYVKHRVVQRVGTDDAKHHHDGQNKTAG